MTKITEFSKGKTEMTKEHLRNVIGEMQIKLALRFHLIPVTMAKINATKTSGSSCWRNVE